MDRLRKFANAPVWFFALQILAISTFLYLTRLTYRFIDQPLADFHAFRQTQTALTAYWMLQDGWSLAYQTPVAGFPWSIPFEFPIYQAIVAAIAALSGFDLGAVGRFVSYAFLVACAWPAFALRRRLDLPATVPWVFCALLWSSPINLYWGRTFMIETAALFFTLACLPYAVDVHRHVGGWRSALLFVVFATAAMLQKVTTGFPVLLFSALIIVSLQLRQGGLNVRTLQRLLLPFVVLGIPLAVGMTWTHYADAIKMENPFGRQLISTDLGNWTFGTLDQKLSPKTWRLIVWERCLGNDARAIFGVLLLQLPWLGSRLHRRFAWLSLAALVFFLLPIAIFTNVHIVHIYYQAGCVTFLLAALAIVVGGWLKEASGTTAIVPIVTAILVLANLTAFRDGYGVAAANQLDQLEPYFVQPYKVGRYLREHTRPGTGLVIFGQDWNSQIAFEAQRKSMTVPVWFSEYRQLWDNPRAYLGGLELSAIVICPPSNQFPTADDLMQRMTRESGWVHESVYGCELLRAQ